MPYSHNVLLTIYKANRICYNKKTLSFFLKHLISLKYFLNHLHFMPYHHNVRLTNFKYNWQNRWLFFLKKSNTFLIMAFIYLVIGSNTFIIYLFSVPYSNNFLLIFINKHVFKIQDIYFHNHIYVLCLILIMFSIHT